MGISGDVLLVLLFVVYALFSRRLAHSSFTAPMLFTAAGLLAATDFFGSAAVDTFALELRSDTVQLLLEGTLVIVLFSDAARIDSRYVRTTAFLPTRLLLIGLPLTIAFGTAVALLVEPELGFWSAAIIAIILAPTDAALGESVVSNERVPVLVRQGLAVESGLNDGLVVPLLAIALAAADSEMTTAAGVAELFLKEIGLAILIGAGVGWLGARAVRASSAAGWMGREGRQVLVVFLAVLCALLAIPVDASAFIAAFIGGAVFGAGTRGQFPEICHFSEGVGHLMTMLAFFIFGSAILYPSLETIGWRAFLYAILSLSVIRFGAVLVSLIGTKLMFPTQAYVGWFGPRGLASLVFMGTVVVESDTEFAALIINVAAATVALSVLLHGVSAWPASNRYAQWYERSEEADPEPMVEGQEVKMVPHRSPGDVASMDR
ncbi:MAG: cation:proton antiporter [Acidimicrobiia bacterium]|nr:cation:proton antiporter [Acidimicrobiia bacterium]